MIGALSMWIERKALTAVATSKAKPSLKQSKLLGMHQTIEDLSVDFHGMTVSEAIEAAESALNSALLKNANRIELIHGIGSGKLKTALQGYMNNSPHVQRCEIDPNNPGTSWAYLGSKA
jgi:DNA mismatch repair protein MutS2